MADVFISYARTERAEAEAIKARLEAMGLTVFLDVDGLDGGDVFSEKLDREVKTAGVVLGLWSPTSLSRPWVQTECDIGKRRGVLVPVAIHPFRDMDVPAPFWNIQFIDLTEALHHADDPAWAKLQRSLSRTLVRPTLAPPRATPAQQASQNSSPDWLHTRTAPAPRPKPKASATPLVLGIMLLLVLAGGATVLFADPFGWMTQRTPVADAAAPAGPALAEIGAPPAPSKGSIDPSQTLNPGQTPGGAIDPSKLPVLELPPAQDKLRDPTGQATQAAPAPSVEAAKTPAPKPSFKLVEERTIQAHGPGGSFSDPCETAASFSPDSARVISTGCDNAGSVWDANTGAKLFSLDHSGRVLMASFSRSGDRILTASSDRTAKIWNASTGVSLFTLSGHAGPVRKARFSRDGSMVVTASTDGARIWNAQTGKLIKTLRNAQDFFTSVSIADAMFSPDGGRLLTTTDANTAFLWEISSDREPTRISYSGLNTPHIDFSPDGSRIVIASPGYNGGLWDGYTGASIAKIQNETGGYVEFSSDGLLWLNLAANRRADPQIRNGQTGVILRRLAGAQKASVAAFMPDGFRVLTSTTEGGTVDYNSTIKLWNAKTGALLATQSFGSKRANMASGSPQVSGSPDGRRVAAADGDGDIRIFRIEPN